MIFVCEAKLSASVSLLGSMSPFVQVNYGDLCTETHLSRGSAPSWSEVFHFDSQEEDLELVVFHRPILFAPVEVGRVSLKIQKHSGWFEIRKGGKITGMIRIILNEQRVRHSASYSTAGSWDLECLKKMNELELKKEESLYLSLIHI